MFGGHHVDDAIGNAGAVRQFGQRQRAQRGEFSRLDDDGAAGCDGRSDLARDHRDREVPGRDGGADADGLAQHDGAAVRREAGHGLAVGALGFFGIPLDEAGAVDDFARGFGQWLALFGGHQAGQIVLVRQDQLEPLAQQLAALLVRHAAPGGQGGFGSIDGLLRLGGGEVGNLRQFQTGGGIGHGEGAVTLHPGAVDVAGVLEQGGVLELEQGGVVGGHGCLVVVLENGLSYGAV